MTAQDEVVGICRDLIRIDTSNYGDDSGPGERVAAEHVMGLLTEVGLDPELFESEPGRASVVVRLEGSDSSRPALVLHGHLDVVPARADDWSVDPFGAEEVDGLVWGRGAVDMKDMDAMILAVVRQMAREGRRPARDVVVAMFADEEAGGAKGARWAVDNRPDLFEGATEAISEVGGFSVDVDGRRAYLLQTAEKGLSWLRLVADGRAGHGSQVNADNAVTHLAEAVARLGRHPWPLQLTPDRAGAAGRRGAAHRADLRPGGPRRDRRPRRGARTRVEVRRRHAAEHHEPDAADGRLQGERHPRLGGGDGRRSLPARATRRSS